MDFPTEWNTNKYYDTTEVPEHWSLRKAFMEKFKNMYPEDRLVGLSKVFYNMEFMGCQYNQELMKLVQNMSNEVDIIAEHRERKKFKLKRTFVRASDAVKRKTIEPNEETEQKTTVSFVSGTSEINWQEYKKSKTQMKKRDRILQKKMTKQKNKVTFNIKNQLDIDLLNRVQNQPGIKGKLVLFEKENGALLPYQILERSAQKSRLLLKILPVATEPGKYEMKINDEIVAEYTMSDLTIPVSKKKAYPDSVRTSISQIAYDYLKQYCFTTVELNPRDPQAISTDITQKNEEKDDGFQLPMDSIGAKMMKQMGWGGQGLGKNETGIVKPIEAEIRVSRRGFGNPEDNISFKRKIKNYLQNYISTGETKRLFFSSDFTKEDRAYIHELTGSMGGLLQSKSYGKNENRYLTVERKLTVWEIVEQLLANGGSTDRYSLKKPTMIL